jgi:hypothetical protein
MRPSSENITNVRKVLEMRPNPWYPITDISKARRIIEWDFDCRPIGVIEVIEPLEMGVANEDKFVVECELADIPAGHLAEGPSDGSFIARPGDRQVG